jgi:hypothetical protein
LFSNPFVFFVSFVVNTRGAVVNRNVPDHALVVGNPGKPVGWMCRCGERLTDDLECLSCDRGYRKTENGLEEVAGHEFRKEPNHAS